MSNTVTQGIRVRVESEYVPQQSDPRKNYYFFIYHVELSNEGDQPAQLVSTARQPSLGDHRWAWQRE